jgi:SAM (Sterile alpha motif) domain-containing protein
MEMNCSIRWASSGSTVMGSSGALPHAVLDAGRRGDWLRSLGLRQYEAVFRENEIDDTVLPELDSRGLQGPW